MKRKAKGGRASKHTVIVLGFKTYHLSFYLGQMMDYNSCTYVVSMRDEKINSRFGRPKFKLD